jgi:hypothetical protein
MRPAFLPTVVCLVLLAASPAGGATASWGKIDSFGLGMLQNAVYEQHGFGTSGSPRFYTSYRAGGGRVDLLFKHGRVSAVSCSASGPAGGGGCPTGFALPDGVSLSEQRLRELLAQQAESPTLEFVGDCDLTKRRDIVELASEVGATERRARLFDEATLHDKLDRYLPPSLELRVGRHKLDSEWVVIIRIEPHPDGAVAFAADGTFEHEGKPVTAFRKGEIFVRHGTSSERPTQLDVQQIAETAVTRAKLWLDQLRAVEDAVSAISEVVHEEAKMSPDGRLASVGRPTRLPTARARLTGRLAALQQLDTDSLTER